MNEQLKRIQNVLDEQVGTVVPIELATDINVNQLKMAIEELQDVLRLRDEGFHTMTAVEITLLELLGG